MRQAHQVGKFEQGNETMDTTTEKEIQGQEDALSYQNVNLVEGGVGDGSEMTSPAIFGGEVLTDNGSYHMGTHSEPLMNDAAANQVNPDSGSNIEGVLTSSQQSAEEACCSSDIFDCFVTKLSRDIASALDPTPPATSFILFLCLPVELQRRIWFHALPSPDIFDVYFNQKRSNNDREIELSVLGSSLSNQPEPSYELRFVCHMAREVFLEHYSRLKFASGSVIQRIEMCYDHRRNDFRCLIVSAKPGSWFDMRFDVLYFVQSRFTQMEYHSKIFNTSFDFTLLRNLSLDSTYLEVMIFERDSSGVMKFWQDLESLFPRLEQLFFILNPHIKGLDCMNSPVNPKFRDFDTTFTNLLRYRQSLESNEDWNVFEKTSICRSFQKGNDIAQQFANHTNYHQKVFRPVWLVYIIPPRTSYMNMNTGEWIIGPCMVLKNWKIDIHLRCNADGTLPDQYEGIKDLFSEQEDLTMLDID
ncbi:hypothetical protein NHQ30_005168 [Ciborinia camelliae]|nr:hypothetical protein NHQ30_005168 [Ciborinia camelliae]